MYRNSLVFVLLAGSVTSSFAASILPFEIIHKKHVHQIAASKNKMANLNKYTDFSGNWQGTCIIDQEQTPANIVIDNDDKIIQIDGRSYYINALHTESIASNEEITSVHTTFTWGPDGTTLILKYSMVTKELTDLPIEDEGFLFSRSSFEINHNKLFIHGYYDFPDNLSGEEGRENFNCTLDKVG